MSRTKKSRKPGVGSSGTRKADVSPKQPKEKRIRKKTGNAPGTRQQVAQKKSNDKSSATSKDPRIGSKKPIVLIKPDADKTPKVTKQPKTKPEAIAKIRTVEPSADLQHRLREIENDAWLLEIVDKQEAEQALSLEEIEHFNQLMEEHQAISEQLGIDEDAELTSDDEQTMSEDDLWHKFDNADLSDFKEE